MNIGSQTRDVLRALRENSENGDREGWRNVYLDNAKASEQCSNMRRSVFRAHLARLSQCGLYDPIDGYAWGSVKMIDS
jgi:hypothetical protein